MNIGSTYIPASHFSDIFSEGEAHKKITEGHAAEQIRNDRGNQRSEGHDLLKLSKPGKLAVARQRPGRSSDKVSGDHHFLEMEGVKFAVNGGVRPGIATKEMEMANFKGTHRGGLQVLHFR